MEQVWLKGGTICMGFGMVLFLTLMLKAKKSNRPHFSALIFIVATAMASYMAMSLGQLHIQLGDGHTIYAARYLDWLITTPLLLLSMAYVASEKLRHTGVALAAAVGADIYMIVTGLAGGVTSGDGKWAWFAISCLGFVGVLILVWGSIRAAAKDRDRLKAFNALAALLTILWVQYPVVWYLGEEGNRTLSPTVETAWYTVLDVLAKVGFGMLSIYYMRSFPEHVEKADSVAYRTYQ